MSLRKKTKHIIIKHNNYDMNKRLQPISKKYFFHPPPPPPGSDKFLNFFIAAPKTFQLS